MPVIDHFLHAGFYLPACSCFIDCPCSLDPSPWHGGPLLLLLLLASLLLWKDLSAQGSSAQGLQVNPAGAKLIFYIKVAFQ